MGILHSMAKNGEIDKDLVKFFYTSGVYKEFAKQHLSQEQIDEVELDFSDF